MSGNTNAPSLLEKTLHSPPKFNLIVTLEKELQDVPEDAINTLSRKIYPVETLTSNFYNSLYRSLLNYFMIQSNKGYEYETIVGDVIGFSSHINDLLMAKITQILKTEDVKNRLLESSLKINNLSMTKNLQNANKKTPSSSLLDNLSNKYSKESSNKYGHLLDDGFRRENNNNLTIENQDVGASIAEKYIKDKSNVENLIDRISFEKQLTKAGKIGNKKCLVCDSLVVLNELNRNQLSKNTFKCIDCGEIFHKKCMQRENNCSFCQLSNINPLQKARTPLFLGILKKGTKRHQLEFEISKSHFKSELSEFSQQLINDQLPTIELRSIRMKDTVDPVSNFINLFPDACSLMINTKLMREFEPLHKQSSLKYRRDECMKISSNLSIGNNKIVITERINKKDMKPDERIELDNHLVGVYIVENLQIPRSTNYSHENFSRFLNVIGSTVSEFEESEALLKESLFIKDKNSLSQIEEDQELVCDSVKVPLICSLTLQKMKFPGRTIFCKHFNCFDVENFILLNAQAKLPKWQCPICKVSAYKFQIDCVLSSILLELERQAKENMEQKNLKIKENEKVSEVELNRKLEIKLLNTEDCILISKGSNIVKNPRISYLETEFVPFWIKRIYDLPIEGKNKREREREENEERSILNKLDESVSAVSLVDEKPASKYNEEQIQRIIEAVEKNNINPFIISLEEPNRAILQYKEIESDKERHLNGEGKKPMPFEVRIESFKEKQNKTNSQMKDENEERGSKKDTSKKDHPINNQCVDSLMVDGEAYEANEQIRKLQFYDSSENSMKNCEERAEIESENNSKEKVIEIEENKVMEECEQVEQREEKNPELVSSLFPSEIQKSDVHEEDEEMEKAFAQYQQNCYDKMKRVLESGAELPKVINPQVIQNMNESLQKEQKQKENNELEVSYIFKCSQPQSEYSIEGAKFNASYHSVGNDFGEEFEEEEPIVNKMNFEEKVEVKEGECGEYLYGDHKEIERDESKNIKASGFNVVIDKYHKFCPDFRESEKEEIEGNSSSQVSKPITSSPQTFHNKRISERQKEKFDKILNNAYTSKSNPSKNDSKMITRKRAAKNAASLNSKVNQREKISKDFFVVPDDADVIELSD